MVDSNILVHKLDLLQYIASNLDVSRVKILIPYQVLREIDSLKKNQNIGAKRANDWLYAQFASNKPCIVGQSKMVSEIHLDSDDQIIQACVDASHKADIVVLLSDDKNICLKVPWV